jgi:transcription elongation factor Elf1
MKVIWQREAPELRTYFAECSRCRSLLVLDASEYFDATHSATYCANCGWHITTDDLRLSASPV